MTHINFADEAREKQQWNNEATFGRRQRNGEEKYCVVEE